MTGIGTSTTQPIAMFRVFRPVPVQTSINILEISVTALICLIRQQSLTAHDPVVSATLFLSWNAFD